MYCYYVCILVEEIGCLACCEIGCVCLGVWVLTVAAAGYFDLNFRLKFTRTLARQVEVGVLCAHTWSPQVQRCIHNVQRFLPLRQECVRFTFEAIRCGASHCQLQTLNQSLLLVTIMCIVGISPHTRVSPSRPRSPPFRTFPLPNMLLETTHVMC